MASAPWMRSRCTAHPVFACSGLCFWQVFSDSHHPNESQKDFGDSVHLVDHRAKLCGTIAAVQVRQAQWQAEFPTAPSPRASCSCTSCSRRLMRVAMTFCVRVSRADALGAAPLLRRGGLVALCARRAVAQAVARSPGALHRVAAGRAAQQPVAAASGSALYDACAGGHRRRDKCPGGWVRAHFRLRASPSTRQPMHSVLQECICTARCWSASAPLRCSAGPC